MWQLENRTPYAAERTWVRGMRGEEIWIVAVKCTFDIFPDGTLQAAATQPPVIPFPQTIDRAAPGDSSLLYDMDLVRTKTATDVVLHGHACAPHGEAVTQLDVGFRVGPLAKRLCVTGERVWAGRTPSRPTPFTRMPLVYERAFGGFDAASLATARPQWDMRNPVGIGYVAPGAKEPPFGRLPEIEYPDERMQRWNDLPRPAGFGPIPGHWQPRASLAGTCDEAWERERMPLLPLDFDDRHYQCAPADQQVPGFLTGGEPVVLLNLTPAGALRFNLPRVHLGMETFFHTGARRRHDPPRLHTVIIEPDLARVSLVWHSALSCHPLVYKLERTRIIEKALVNAPANAAASVSVSA